MRILMMTAIAALAIGTAADARTQRMKRTDSGSAAVKELNRKSLEQASAGSMGASMAQPGMAAAPMSDSGSMNAGNASMAPSAPGSMTPGGTSSAPMGRDSTMTPAPAMTPPAAGTTPQ